MAEIEAAFALQPAIWPEAGVSTEPAPYARLDGAVGFRLPEGATGLRFDTGGRAGFDTYFNLLNLAKWDACCGPLPLSLRLEGHGRFTLTISAADEGLPPRPIAVIPIALDGTLVVPAPLETLADRRVLLSFALEANEAGLLQDFAWQTTRPPRQRPQIVLAVTTFRREEAAARTAARFEAWRRHSPIGSHLRMLVVDNGQSVAIADSDAVRVLANPNLGGAGGFSRGLIEARALGASHALFMDDDASIHMGSITRAWMLLAYATDPRTTIAAAMIDDDHRWRIWENGATFDRGCRALFFGTDLRDPEAVARMEFASTGPAPEGFYGGWWFFVFPLAAVTHLPFPFFVRGDDVSFSLANDLRIVTQSGVASFQQSFVDKASPQTWYLDMRSHLAHHLALPDRRRSWFALQRMLLSFYARTALRFHYDSLEAVNLAIEDTMRGPDFFAENADMAVRRATIRDLTRTEIWAPVSVPPKIRHGRLRRPARAVLLATLNGHLLPFADRFGSRLVIDAPHREGFRLVYGAREITYLNAARDAAYTVTRDRRRWLRETGRFLRNTLRLLRDGNRLHRDWQVGYARLTTEEFWRRTLGLPEGGAERSDDR